MSGSIPTSPIIVIFGITGDLSKRKLLPALYHLFKNDLLSEETKIIGTSRRSLNINDLINTVELCVLDKDKACDPKVLEIFYSSLETMQIDPNNVEDFKSLKKLIDQFDPEGKRVHMFYMSIPSKAYGPIIDHLEAASLNTNRARLLLEKPFGYDLNSAKQLIEIVHRVFSENQIYRIDHYLAKETAQNLLAFRLHNPIFIPLWNCRHIQRIHVRALETIGIEGRANFYEQTGALRDFVQSHLMQLLSITMMPLPEDMSSRAIHESKQAYFSGLNPADPHMAVRGQYDSYRNEVSSPDSNVETYAKLILSHNSETWRDTQIVLETGKGMGEKTTDITVEFKTPHERRRNNLIFQLQPNEGISLDLVVKEPGLANNMHHTALDFRYASTFPDYVYFDAYERVLMDAFAGDQSLFASDKEVIETWRVLQPLLEYWQSNTNQLNFYTVGSKEVNLT